MPSELFLTEHNSVKHTPSVPWAIFTEGGHNWNGLPRCSSGVAEQLIPRSKTSPMSKNHYFKYQIHASSWKFILAEHFPMKTTPSILSTQCNPLDNMITPFNHLASLQACGQNIHCWMYGCSSECLFVSSSPAWVMDQYKFSSGAPVSAPAPVPAPAFCWIRKLSALMLFSLSTTWQINTAWVVWHFWWGLKLVWEGVLAPCKRFDIL